MSHPFASAVWIMLLLIAAHPAFAEPTFVMQIQAGADRIDISADRIKSIQIVGPLLLPAISVVLVPEMDAPIVRLTSTHVGEELVIRACGEEVMRPILQDALSKATFMLAVKDGDEAHRIARLLLSKDCAK